MNKKQFRDEMKSYIAYFAYEIDKFASECKSDKCDWFLNDCRCKAIGLAMAMSWADVFTHDEFEDVNDNMPLFYSHYLSNYEKFVDFYKRWGGEHLESFDRV